MAICCGGKKQKVSHPVTSSLNHRQSFDKQKGLVDHDCQHCLKLNSSPSSSSTRRRSQSHFNYHSNNLNHLAMPHDLSRSSANSASSSALTTAYGTSQTASSSTMSTTKANPYHNKTTNVSDDDDDDDLSRGDHEQKQKNRFQQMFDRSSKTQVKQSMVHADMVFYCFEILGNYLFHGKYHLDKYHSSSISTNGQFNSSPLLPPTLPTEHYPLFVTWLIGSEQKLRGCIGTFTPMNLAQGLHEYALTSATNDSRFSPISRDEYPLLSCAVSILTNFEPCSSYSDWVIGRHGIRIEFMNERGSKRSATYLPEVASEQGWNHIQTLDSLLRKGGYRARITPDMRQSVHVTRYRSEKLTLHYNDYVQSKTNSSLPPTIIRQKF